MRMHSRGAVPVAYPPSPGNERDLFMPKINAFLEVMQKVGASDLHLGAGSVPILRIHGALEKTRHKALNENEVRLLLFELLPDILIERLEKSW